MQEILKQLEVDPSRISWDNDQELPALKAVNGCLFLAEELAHSPGVKLDQFPDRTGIECFVNHIHFKVNHDKGDLEQVLDFASALRRSIKLHGEGLYQIIVAVVDTQCTVRFHRVRKGEEWLHSNLETYERESILVLPVQC